MKRVFLVALLALSMGAAAAPGAAAKGMIGSSKGATVPGLPYRYVAITPNSPYQASAPRRTAGFTVVSRIDKQGGRLGRWWYLPGRYSIPTAAFDDAAGGLSADGGTLVLSRFSWIYPPRTTGLAIVHTERHPGRVRGTRRIRQTIDKLSLPGSYSFDAISPDGSTVYLIEHLSKVFGGAYQVRALDVRRGRLLPEAIVDPAEPMEQMEGQPISRATSPGGRWAYTLYTDHKRGKYELAHEPFVHALDTVAGRAVCIDLPQLEGRPSRFLLRLRVAQEGRELEVFSKAQARDRPPSPTLLTVDTRSFEVRKPEPVATASGGIGALPPIAALGAIAVALLAWIGLRHRREPDAEEMKP
jgi:hypothetical protein